MADPIHIVIADCEFDVIGTIAAHLFVGVLLGGFGEAFQIAGAIEPSGLGNFVGVCSVAHDHASFSELPTIQTARRYSHERAQVCIG
jgi:hypothetical protein